MRHTTTLEALHLDIDVVYLPTYSPELNPVELVFNKLKIVLKREEMQPVVRANLHAAIYNALEEITENVFIDTQTIFFV